MNRYMVFGVCVAVFVTGGLIWRARRSTEGGALMQFAGGLNVFAAALLAWMTAVTLFMSFNGQLELGTAFFEWSSIAFVVALSVVWVVCGLVPQTIAVGCGGKTVLGHLLLTIGTVVHGSVTFYMPVLVWLGLLSEEATAVLPWFAIFTLPLACVCWAVGMALIVDAGTEKRLQELRIESQ